jgi:hypothetical protein
VDRVLVALLLVLTFFLGSFAARNADFLMNLASGRLIAHGEYRFGVDPFAYGTEDAVWVNHSWLFDWLVYALWSVTGDAGPIVFKALLMAALALILLGVRRPGQSVSVPVLYTGLAVLAVSPRMLMQSTCVSFLFFGITIYVLARSRRIWLLPLLFALWVNLDAWFVLGPVIVAWYLIGSTVQRLAGQAPEYSPAKLGLVLVAGLAACLINPHHYRAFMLPPEWAYMAVQAGDLLPSWMVAGGKTIQGFIQGEQFLPRNQQGFRLLWLSPLSEEWRNRPDLGYHIAGFSYFPLLLLGLVSFAVAAVRNARVFPWPRLLVWLFFAFLSLVQARLIPFFAVIAGPLTALNFQDYFTAARPAGESGQERPPTVAGRLVTALLFLGLIFLAWPGWMHVPVRIYPFDFHAAHRVAWKIDFDPSLEKAVPRLGELHKKGLIRRGFAFAPDVACYCAWFAPEVKGFIDFRYNLFADRARDFIRTRAALARVFENPKDASTPKFSDWGPFATKFDVDYVVVTNVMRNTIHRLAGVASWIEPTRWPWLYGDGRTLIFGWNDSGKDSPLNRETLSLGKLAFGPVPPEERAPGTGAALPEGDLNFWDAYLTGTAGPSLALDTAEQFQLYHKFFSDQLQQTCQRLAHGTIFHGPMAMNVAAPASVTLPGVLFADGLRTFRLGMPVYGPPSAPVLMMRNVRRALAENPYEAPAYEVFANAVNLEKLQEDAWALRQEPSFRQQMRQLQLIAAWKNYLNLKPDDPRAHRTMASIYDQQLHYLDVALEHLGLAVKHWDRQPRPAPQEREQFEAQRKSLEALYQRLDKEVKRRQDAFDLQASGRSASEKVALALGPGQGLGLARKALQALQQVKLSQLGEREKLTLVLQQVSLLLFLGEIREVNEALPNLKGLGGYFQFQVFCAAAAGEYDRADAAIAAYLDLAVEKRLLPLLWLQFMKAAPTPLPAGVVAQLLCDRQSDIAGFLRHGAEWHLLRGILALERGDTELARNSFQRVRALAESSIYFAELPIADKYLKLIQDNH